LTLSVGDAPALWYLHEQRFQKYHPMKKLSTLLLSVCVATFVYAQNPASKNSGVASDKPVVFELPKAEESLYILNDSTVISAEQFKAIDPKQIQSVEVRHYANEVGARPDTKSGVIAIYLKGHRSFSTPHHNGVASEKPLSFEPPKTMEPLYIVNDTDIITHDQLKGLNPSHIESVEVRHYDNTILSPPSGVVHIYLKGRTSFSEEFSRHKKNPAKN
jgi:hypothetical protein